MKVNAQMYDTIKDQGIKEHNEKMEKKLSLIQKAKLYILEKKISNTMKKGERRIYADYIEERLIRELEYNGFKIRFGNLGCAAIPLYVYIISW